MIRKKNVLINRKPVLINYKLQENDQLEFYGYLNNKVSSNDIFLNLSKLRPLQVVYEDDNVIIVNKEVGITVQEDFKNQFNNMNNRLLNHLNWKYDYRFNHWKPTFIHRLDKNTSGLLIGAKTYLAYKELSEAIKKRQIDKYYLTVVKGLVPFKHKKISNYLIKLQDQNKVIETNKNNKRGKIAISEISLIKHIFETKNSVLEVKLITGRTHQIRVHLSGLGFPIRGDQKYGIEKDKKKYHHPVLIAYKLHFSEDITGESIKQLKGKLFTIDSYLTENINL